MVDVGKTFARIDNILSKFFDKIEYEMKMEFIDMLHLHTQTVK